MALAVMPESAQTLTLNIQPWPYLLKRDECQTQLLLRPAAVERSLVKIFCDPLNTPAKVRSESCNKFSTLNASPAVRCRMVQDSHANLRTPEAGKQGVSAYSLSPFNQSTATTSQVGRTRAGTLCSAYIPL